MKILLCSALILLILSCSGSESDYVAPEYTNWYTLTSPIDDVIQGVWGDRDKTLLISTTYTIFRSTDQGRNWQQVYQQQTGIGSIVEYKDTLFTMNGLIYEGDNQFLANPAKYSVDEGKSWSIYRTYNRFFDSRPSIGPISQKLCINLVTTPTGTIYKINRVYLDSTAATVRRFDTPGVITSDGRKIDLPQYHQLRSLYMDAKNRLYLTATDAICDRGRPGQGFSFCNSQNGRGIVYISKQALP